MFTHSHMHLTTSPCQSFGSWNGRRSLSTGLAHSPLLQLAVRAPTAPQPQPPPSLAARPVVPAEAASPATRPLAALADDETEHAEMDVAEAAGGVDASHQASRGVDRSIPSTSSAPLPFGASGRGMPAASALCATVESGGEWRGLGHECTQRARACIQR